MNAGPVAQTAMDRLMKGALYKSTIHGGRGGIDKSVMYIT